MTAEGSRQKVPFSETPPKTCAALALKGRSFFVSVLFVCLFVCLGGGWFGGVCCILVFSFCFLARRKRDELLLTKKVSHSWRMAGSSPSKDYGKHSILSKHKTFPGDLSQHQLLTPHFGTLPLTNARLGIMESSGHCAHSPLPTLPILPTRNRLER